MELKSFLLRELIRVQQNIMSSQRHENDLLVEICTESQALTKATGAAVEFAVGEDMVYMATSGSCKDFLGVKIPKNNSLSGKCVMDQAVMICADSETDDRVNIEACRKIGLRSMVVVPLVNDGHIMGVLKVLSDVPSAFDSSTVEILSLLSGFLGSAINKAQISEQLMQQNDFLDRKVKERAAQLVHLSEMIPQLVWQTDSKGKRLYVNSKWAEYLGEGVEVDFKSIVHPDDYENTMAIWKKALEEKTELRTEYRLRSKTGEYGWFFVRGVPTYTEDGTSLYWYGTCTDISEQKRAQLERSELIIREKSAQEASRLKSEFLANMSHEIRTPLNGIMGMVQLLLSRVDNPEEREDLEVILRSSKDLMVIISDILDFSKVEMGKMELEKIDFDLRFMLSDIEKSFGYMARKKNIHFEICFENEIFNFYQGDPGRIRQILNNLISNAIKFTLQGSVMVHITETKQAGNSCTLRFDVVDTGVGVPVHAREKIFAEFSQADTSTTRRFGGTGLGLSISKKLVDLMNGKMGLSSDEGKGSAFWFEITLDKGLAFDKNFPNFSSLVKLAQDIQVLVAEDNAVNQKVALRSLEKMGYRAQVVANGKEVLQALAKERFDLILMDCQMPEMDGYEATQKIRSGICPSAQNIPIVAMTASAIAGERERCLSVGMDDYISKPLILEELARVLERWTYVDKPMETNLAETSERAPAALIDMLVIQSLTSLASRGSKNLVQELIDVYLEDSEKLMVSMSGFFQSKNYAQLAKEAHSLKSGSGTLGAYQMERLSKEIELLCLGHSPEAELPRLMAELNLCYEKSCVRLLEIRNENPQEQMAELSK